MREITTLHSSIDKISDNSVDMTLDNIYSEELQDGTTYITESGKILIGIDCDTVPSKIKITAPTTTFAMPAYN